MDFALSLSLVSLPSSEIVTGIECSNNFVSLFFIPFAELDEQKLLKHNFVIDIIIILFHSKYKKYY